MIETDCSRTPSTKLIFACSGAADVGAIADQAARKLSKAGDGKMFYTVGLGGKVEPSLSTPTSQSLLHFPSTSLWRRVAWVKCLFVLSLAVYGCVPGTRVDVYDGPTRSLQEVAVLIVEMNRWCTESAGPHIEAVDGKKVNHWALEYHLLPGPHTIDFTYRGKGGSGRIYTKEPWRLEADFKEGHVYRIFSHFLGSDPNERFPLSRGVLAGVTSGIFRGPKGYFQNGLLLLGTVEEVACLPELLPDHQARHKVKGAAIGGVFGIVLAGPPAPAQAWKQLAETHCPDKTRE